MSGSRHRPRTGLLLLGALIALLAACTNSEKASTAPATTQPPASVATPPARTYVGTVSGTSALVSVVVDGSRALGYVCDGMPGDGAAGTTPTIQAWFNGPSDGKTVDVAQPGGRLQLQLTDTTMTGTITLADGRSAPVTGTAVTGDAGLYRAAATGALAGWILAADGEQRGGFTSLEGGGALGIPRLLPNNLTINFRNLSNTQIAKVGTTPIPIP